MFNKRINWLYVYLAIYLIFLYLPMFLLPMFAFNDSTTIAFPLKGFTFKWFTLLPEIDAMIQSVYNSLIIAISTSIIATTLGMCAARAWARYQFPGKSGIIGLIMIPLVLPEIVVAVSLLVVLLNFGVTLNLWTIVLGHVLIATPFCTAILTSAFLNLDESLEEASLDLGETRFTTFRLVVLPLVTPGIIASLIIAFMISLDEFIIAFFLTGTEPTLPVYLYSQLRFPAKLPIVMSLGTILLMLSLILVTTAEYFRRRGIHKSSLDQKDIGGTL